MLGRVATGILAALILLIAAPTAGAEDPPTIGLALGGGGARGLAHVGVLLRLDELRIPVHYIAGTSMGAVVGAEAALGFPPAEIERMALSVDWRHLMADRPDRRQLTYRRKTDSRNSLWPFEFGITRQGLGLQRGFLFGQKFTYVFNEPDLYTAGYDGFDALPIPFRAVATDLETGEAVVLDQDNLMRAVRASMAASGAFPPVEIDGRTLVDGYLRTMVPVDAVRDMGADKVIAVHVGWSPGELPPAGVWNVPTIVLQANYILTWANVAPDLALADVPIAVSLPDVPLFDFTQAETAIAAGRQAVDAQREALLPLALSQEDYARWRASVGRRRVAAPIITRVSVENLRHVDERSVLGRIRQVPGDTLDFAGLVRDLDRIFELGTFESVEFSLPANGAGRELLIQPVEKPYLPWVVNFGASYRMNYQNRGQIQFLGRLARREINRFGGEFRGDLALGSLHSVHAEFYQPLDPSRTLFMAPGVFWASHDETVFDGSYQLGSYRTDSRGGHVDLGLNLGRIAEVRAGWWRGEIHSEAQAGFPDVPTRTDEIGALHLTLGFDRLDDSAIPHQGLAGSLRAWLARPSLGDDLDFGRYWGHLVGAASVGKWIVQMRAQGGSSEGDLPYYHDFLMGGLRDITGVADGSLRGRAFAMGGAGVLYHLAGLKLPYMPQWYLGGWMDVGNTWQEPEQATWRDTYWGGAITLLVETPLGPIETGYGHSSIGRNTIYLQAGIQFAQPFNP